MRNIILITALIIFGLFFGKQLLPSDKMFTFHDVSQPARIQEFAFDLTHKQIPPRIAPHMSFGMGYPVFTFYAPFSYWVGSGLHLAGFDIADSIKLSFFLGLFIAFFSMFYFLRLFFKGIPAFFGAFLYSTSPYLAMEIFARGNLGEIWFLALLPASLYFLYKNAGSNSPQIAVLTAVVTSFALTAHNVLSLVFIPLVVIYVFLLKNIKKNLFSLALSILLSSYFLIPAFLESGFTNASKIAEFTRYHDHFLCWWQIWTTNVWGYGASNPGCMADGISFMLGKIQIIFGVLGLASLFFFIVKHQSLKKQHVYLFIALITIISAFMTTYSSEFIWKAIPFLAVFQFPWRFLIYTLFGLSFFSAYFFSNSRISWLKIAIPVSILFILFIQSKYFEKVPISKQDFNKRYTSESVIHNSIAYRVAEYLPIHGDYMMWRSIETDPEKQNNILKETKDFIYPMDNADYSVLKNEPFEKKAMTNSTTFLLNVHYLPFWSIRIDNKEYIPEKFDVLGRPWIALDGSKGRLVTVVFQQTQVEMLSNYLTILGIVLVIFSAQRLKKHNS